MYEIKGLFKTASARDINLWKDGKKRLWLCTYSGTIEQVERKAVDLADVKIGG